LKSFVLVLFFFLQIDRSKVDEMSNGEKKVLTIPKNATVLKAILIDEEDRLIVTKSLNDRFSQQLVSTAVLLFAF